MHTQDPAARGVMGWPSSSYGFGVVLKGTSAVPKRGTTKPRSLLWSSQPQAKAVRTELLPPHIKNVVNEDILGEMFFQFGNEK